VRDAGPYCFKEFCAAIFAVSIETGAANTVALNRATDSDSISFFIFVLINLF
jgi:hypothetical protein